MTDGNNTVSQRAEELWENTDLSKRESEVVALKEQGLTHKEIARRFSDDTADVDVSSISEYSRRAGEKYRKAVNTVDQLKSVYEEANHD